MNWLEKVSPTPRHAGVRVFTRGIINPWRVLNDYELFIFTHGDASFVLEKTEYHIASPWFLIVPPGVRHISYCHSESVTVSWCHFDWEYREPENTGQRLTYDMEDRTFFEAARKMVFPSVPHEILKGPIPNPGVPELHIRFSHLFNRRSAKSRLLARSLFLEELIELLVQDEKKEPVYDRDEQIARQTRMLLDEIARRPFQATGSVKAELAKLGISYFHQERIFRKTYGIPPYRYLTMLRMEGIKRILLEYPGRTIGEIAGELGFPDPAYFCRFFRKHTGTSPDRFRRGIT